MNLLSISNDMSEPYSFKSSKGLNKFNAYVYD